jgi:hypothetical protein
MSEKANEYLAELTELEKKLECMGIETGDLVFEKSAINNYKEVLGKFDSYDPQTQEIILEDVRRDIDRIKLSYKI